MRVRAAVLGLATAITAAVINSAGAAPALASPSGIGPAALPAANMEAVVKAAQIDPRRPGTALTPGAKASVLLVERALDAKNLLATTYVDGHFGTMTVAAYAAYQRSLGYTGLDASGLPGRTSLTTLGEGRYTVSHVLTPGARVTYHGATMNTRTRAMLVEAEDWLGRTLSITQGSYHPGNPDSAGTHDGGGVLDISVSGMSSSLRTTVVRRLRQVGFAAWLRTPAYGFAYHIHAVAISDTDMSPSAQNQAGDYYLGMNGLADRGPDNGPQVTKVTWEEYQRA